MVFFVSHKILLFTHKPLDTSDKGVQVQSYQNLINEGFEILQTRIITWFSDFFNLFPLHRSRRLAGDVIQHERNGISEALHNLVACGLERVNREILSRNG